MILSRFFFKALKWSSFFVFILTLGFHLQSQTTVVSEDFNGCALPGGWSAIWTDDPTGDMGGSIGPGACGGVFFAYDCTTSATYSLNGDNANFSGCIISMADDDAGAAADGTGEIITPPYDLTPYTNVFLSFDYSFDALSSEFRVDVFDGAIWHNVLAQSADINDSPIIDITPYISNATQVRFVHDDLSNSFAWGLGFDNFLIEEPLPPPPPIPTLSEWGLIFLSLLLLSFGLVAIRQKQIALVGGRQSRISLPLNLYFPFDKKRYLFSLLKTSAFTIALFTIAVFIFGYELTDADLPGSLFSLPLAAYIVYLLESEN